MSHQMPEVKRLAEECFELSDDALRKVKSLARAECANCLCRVSAASHTAYCSHSRIIPAVNYVLVYKRETFAFACETVIQIESCKFYLSRHIFKAELTKEPIVKRSVIFKFERAQRVCYTLFVVGERVCEIIHGIYIPFRSGTMMRMLDNTVHDRIAEVHIGRSHVDFRT